MDRLGWLSINQSFSQSISELQPHSFIYRCPPPTITTTAPNPQSPPSYLPYLSLFCLYCFVFLFSFSFFFFIVLCAFPPPAARRRSKLLVFLVFLILFTSGCRFPRGLFLFFHLLPLPPVLHFLSLAFWSVKQHKNLYHPSLSSKLPSSIIHSGLPPSVPRAGRLKSKINQSTSLPTPHDNKRRHCHKESKKAAY